MLKWAGFAVLLGLAGAEVAGRWSGPVGVAMATVALFIAVTVTVLAWRVSDD